jgi:CheY-like chemotaxis protein
MSIEAPPPHRPARMSSLQQRLCGLRVLVVDDQEDARDLLATIFEGAGAEVTLADSAQAALEAIAEADFGVLVSDIGMPVEDGYDLMRRLRSNEQSRQSPPLPAVAVTAFGAPDDRKKALSVGFQEHLVKPIDWLALLGVVERLGAGRESADATSSA